MLDKEEYSNEQTVESWVMEKCNHWRDHFSNNYEEKFDEYNRLWRGHFSEEDKTRNSERSKIISPALQQAVESAVAEIEEATFGRGTFFDIRDDLLDEQPEDVIFLRNQLHKDFKKTKVRKSVAECLLNSAIYGTGIAEIVIEEEKEMRPASQPIMEGQMRAVGVDWVDRTVCKLRPVQPRNFLIDPVATSVEDAIGVAIDEFVPYHQVEQLQESGVYREADLRFDYYDNDLNADPELTDQPDEKIRLTKYYGLIPKFLMEKEKDFEADEDDGHYIESIVVVANGGILLKAERNAFMMNDRPVVAFPWDIVPGRFFGRGICEKGYNSQKALDAEIRARIDALALTVHPMMAMDATRLPRGSNNEIRPGKVLLTNGDPREVLQPFNFGQVGQITFAQADALQKMVQTSTGAIDSAGIPGSINGEATAAGISMSLGAIIKRHKRTLINFQESFLIPFVKKIAHRYMQFEPDIYRASDYEFEVTSSLGIIAREYEVTQLVQLLQTMGSDSPLYPVLIQSIIDNMNISNREQLQQIIAQASQPNPQAQEAQQAELQARLQFQASQTNALNGQAMESQARAEKITQETKAIPVELEIDQINAATKNIKAGDADDKEFERRLKVTDRLLKEKKQNQEAAIRASQEDTNRAKAQINEILTEVRQQPTENRPN
tara:strand:- start:970 stop:2964 length:1995 start_codon:yes stop_codon:yes gene_type:complete